MAEKKIEMTARFSGMTIIIGRCPTIRNIKSIQFPLTGHLHRTFIEAPLTSHAL
jgi:hypothetical protein